MRVYEDPYLLKYAAYILMVRVYIPLLMHSDFIGLKKHSWCMDFYASYMCSYSYITDYHVF
jgi:hypothetical protein